MRNRFIGVVITAALALTLIGAVSSVVVSQSGVAPDRPVTSAYAEWAVNELSRRVTSLENQSLDRRVGQLESSMDEVKYLMRSVTAAVAGQIVLLIFVYRRGGNGRG